MELHVSRARSGASAGTSGRSWPHVRGPVRRCRTGTGSARRIGALAAHAPSQTQDKAVDLAGWSKASAVPDSLPWQGSDEPHQPTRPKPSLGRNGRGPHRSAPDTLSNKDQHRDRPSSGPSRRGGRGTRRHGRVQNDDHVTAAARQRLLALLEAKKRPKGDHQLQFELDSLIQHLTEKEQVARRERLEAHRPAPAQRTLQPSADVALQQRVSHQAVSRRLKNALKDMTSRIVRAFLRAEHGQLALNFAAHFHGDEGMLALHSGVMYEFAQHSTLDCVFELVRVREQLGVAMDLASMTSMLACAAKEGRCDVIDSTIAAARAAGMVLDAHVYNTALNCYAEARATEAFEDTWHAMHADRCVPNAATHASRAKLLAVTAEGAAVCAYVERLLAVRRAALSPQLFTLAFSSAAGDATLTYERLQRLWDGMVEAGVAVNAFTMSAFFKACRGLQLDAAQVQRCYELVATFSRASGEALSTWQVSTLLSVCKRNGAPGHVTDVWALCQHEKVTVTAPLVVMLLQCCKDAAGDSPAARELAARLADWLRMYWLQQREARKYERKALARTHESLLTAFNALLAYHAQVGEFEEGMTVMQFMHESGPKPDIITYNTLLHCCAGCGQAQVAEELLRDMRSYGLVPNIKSYGAVLNACANACEVGRAQRVLRHMEAQGITPNVVTCTSIMNACIWEGSPHAVKLAMEMLNKMRSHGIALNSRAYAVALQGCELSQDVDAAFGLYHEACAAGVVPTDALHNSLVRVCASCGRLDDALTLIKELMRTHGTMEQDTLNSLTRALCDVYIDRALRMLSFMRTRDMQPGFLTWQALVRGAARASRADVALSLYVEMRTHGHPPRASAGSHLVAALASANCIPAALLVLRDMRACVRGEEMDVAELAAEAAAVAGGAAEAVEARPQDAAAPPVLAAEAHWTSESAPAEKFEPLHDAEAAAASAWGTDGAELTLMDIPQPSPSPQATVADEAAGARSPSLPVSHPSVAERAWLLQDTTSAGSTLDTFEQPRRQGLETTCHQIRVLELTRAVVPLPLGSETSGKEELATEVPDPEAENAAVATDARPRSAAVGQVVTALTASSHLEAAMLLYAQLCAQGPEAMIQHVLARTVMFEKLMELNCRQGRVHAALDVFDEWKRARDALQRRRRASPQGAMHAAWGDRPCLSNVTLAFLEACCHAYQGGDDDLQWRVFDVCAFMRQQEERRRNRRLPQPQKGSHHVGPGSDEEGDSGYEDEE